MRRDHTAVTYVKHIGANLANLAALNWPKELRYAALLLCVIGAIFLLASTTIDGTDR